MTKTTLLILLAMAVTAFGQQPEKEMTRSIRVQGVGKVKAVPDQLRLTFQINVPRAETASEALSRNSKLTAQVIAMLKRNGVAETDMQTTRVSVNPVYDYDKRISPPPIVGYSAQNEVRVVIRKMDDAGKILDQAIQNGATGFGPMYYESSKRTELEREALRKAADAAREKADMLAKQLGVTLGRVISVTEGGVSAPPPMMSMAAESRAMSVDVPVMPGEMDMSASIDVLFELK
jgi:uncharacterized protein YggE